MTHRTLDTIKDVGVSLLSTGSGLALSLSNLETALRITSLVLGIAVSTFVFIKNLKKRKND